MDLPTNFVFRGSGPLEKPAGEFNGSTERQTKPSRRSDPALYVAEPGLVNAVNVALMLGMPLLVSGDPGTGKTQLADRIAYELGLGLDDVLKFETKSTTEAHDLFYEFDLVGRLAAAQPHVRSQQHAQAQPNSPEHTDPRRFITYRALGKAFLLANDYATVERYLPLRNGAVDFPKMDKPRRSVVLIDEIDKASRDFPNDLLNEIELNYFRLRPFDDEKISPLPGYEPIVVITTNSEKNLPDPFLRRCVYYHIHFPDQEKLSEIVRSRMGDCFSEQTLLEDAVDFFDLLKRPRLQRQPTTAELLRWIEVLQRKLGSNGRGLREQFASVRETLSLLCKNPGDQTAIVAALDEWTKQPNRSIRR